MEPFEVKICTNCNREIPAENFLTHRVHCERNLRMCSTCKEPVPASELSSHHDTYHKVVPCKQCGEGISGSDLEDHLRDSCAGTARPCRYCELELPRGEQPEHEGYCGTRTDRCADCGQIVMIKYQQLHRDSNHAFLKLQDEPGPNPSWNAPSNTRGSNLSKDLCVRAPRSQHKVKYMGLASDIASNQNAYSNNRIETNWTPNSLTQGISQISPRTHSNTPSSVINQSPGNELSTVLNRPANLKTKTSAKRTNDMPQVNSQVDSGREDKNKVSKELVSPSGSSNGSREGAIKKRVAPQPPKPATQSPRQGASKPRAPVAPAPPADARRDLAYWSASKRAQQELKERNEQTARNLAQGLPPVLSAAEKLDKLRKMSALQNGEFPQSEKDFKNVLTGRVWGSTHDVPVGNRLGEGQSSGLDLNTIALNHLPMEPMSPTEFMERIAKVTGSQSASGPSRTNGDKATNQKATNVKNVNCESKPKERVELDSESYDGPKNVIARIDTKKSKANQQIDSYDYNWRGNPSDHRGQVQNHSKDDGQWRSVAEGPSASVSASGSEVNNELDRFSNIKNELRQLRRGLNEVTRSPASNPGSSPAISDLGSSNATSTITSSECSSEDSPGRRPPSVKARSQNKKKNNPEGSPKLVLRLPEQTVSNQEQAVRIPKFPNNWGTFEGDLMATPNDVANLNLAASQPDNTNEDLQFWNMRENADADEDDYVRLAAPRANADSVMLPCEFCTELVDALNLVQHETGCRPDLVGYKPQNNRRSSERLDLNLDNRYRQSHLYEEIDDQDERLSNAAGGGDYGAPMEPYIPCEFCLELLPMSRLMNHQATCGTNQYDNNFPIGPHAI